MAANNGMGQLPAVVIERDPAAVRGITLKSF
jgi:hypothetical protein